MIIKEILLFLLWIKGRIIHYNFIPILNYHSLDDMGSVISTPPDEFRRQMRYLKRSGYDTFSLKELVDSSFNMDSSSKRIVITFDDGFKNIYTVAFPLLKELNFTATVFLTTNLIGRLWSVDEDIPEFPMLSWGEIKEMQTNGIDFGAHSLTHPHLTEIELDEAKKEIFGSKKIMEESLKRSIDFFAYPYGDFNEEIINLVRQAGFKGACSAIPPLTNDTVEPFKLRRMDINRFSGNTSFISMLFFKTCLVGTFGYYLKLKSKLPWKRKDFFEYKEMMRKKNAISSSK